MNWEQAHRPRALGYKLLAGMAVAVAAGTAIVIALTGGDTDGALAVQPRPSATPDGSSEREPRAGPSAVPVGATAGSGPLLPGGADFAVVAADQAGWRVIDVATGAVTRWRMTDIGPWLAQAVFASGDDLVINSGLGPSDVYRVAPDGRAVRIARRRQAIPTIDAHGAVWVHDGLSDDFGGMVALVDPDGRIRERFRLPTLTRPAVGTGDGLLITSKRGTELVSDAGSRPIWDDATVVAADAMRVAHVICEPTPLCEVVIGTLDDPDQRRVALAPGDVPGGYFGAGLGAFSPDGRWLALPVFTQSARGYVTLVDTRTGTSVGRLRGSARPFSSAMTWSPDGQWLVVASGTGIDAWNRRTRDIVRLDDESAQALVVP